jgi:hypothetical protein
LDDEISLTKWTDGKVIFISKLLKEFQKFWRHDSDSFPKQYSKFTIMQYDEATYSFFLLAYIQKIVNGGAKVHREFSEGRGSVDINVVYLKKEYLIEVKIKNNEKSRKKSLSQLAKYMDSSGTKEGWLVIFDRDRQKSWEKKINWETVQFEGVTIHVVGC